MAKVIDITDKLSFDENPKLMINGRQYEVNADAETMLKVMNAVKSGDDTKVIGAMSLLFKPKDLEAITRLKRNGKKLSGNALMTIMQAALSLVMGEEEPGEQ